MLGVLASKGHLVQHLGRFHLTESARQFLLPDSIYYCGAALELASPTTDRSHDPQGDLVPETYGGGTRLIRHGDVEGVGGSRRTPQGIHRVHARTVFSGGDGSGLVRRYGRRPQPARYCRRVRLLLHRARHEIPDH